MVILKLFYFICYYSVSFGPDCPLLIVDLIPLQVLEALVTANFSPLARRDGAPTTHMHALSP
jgi:hypothetical protein